MNFGIKDFYFLGEENPDDSAHFMLMWAFSLEYFKALDFPGGSEGKASVCNAGDLGSSPGLGRSPGEGNGNPLQYYCLENPMDRGAWQAAVYGVTKSWTRLSEFTLLHWREAGRANGEWGACSVLGRPLRVLLCYRSFQYFWAALRVLFSPYCFLNPLLPQLQNK